LQFNLTTEKGLLEEQDPQVRGTFFQQQMQLADLQLAGYLQQLDSIKDQDGHPHYGEMERKFEQETQNMIMPFSKYTMLWHPLQGEVSRTPFS
jgi:hypothetical protein